MSDMAGTTAAPVLRPQGWWWLFGALRRDTSGLVGVAIVGLYVLAAIGAPWLAPDVSQGRGTPDPMAQLQPPSGHHLLGTDHLGRDLLSRLIFAARPSLSMALIVIVLAVVIGVPIGAVAGYSARWTDEVLMRGTDVFLSFTPLLLAVVVATALGPGYWSAVVALAVTWWPWYARLARGQAASLRQRPYVVAAQVMGASAPTILVRHIIPNLSGPVLVQATLDLSSVVLIASGLSFLGLGTQPPGADWGVMVNDARIYFLSDPWYVFFSGVAIIGASIGFVMLGDALRRILQLRPTEVAL